MDLRSRWVDLIVLLVVLAQRDSGVPNSRYFRDERARLRAILPIVGPCSRRGIMHVNVIAVAIADKILAREDCRELWVGPSPQPAAYQRPVLGVLKFLLNQSPGTQRTSARSRAADNRRRKPWRLY